MTKAKLKLNWHRELTKWLVRPQSVGIAESDCWPTTDVVIVNYDILHKFKKHLEFYWDLVICDEVQAAKNPASRRAKALFGWNPTRKDAQKSIEKRLFASGRLRTAIITTEMLDAERAALRMTPVPSRRKLALSGTPIENRPIEIQPVLAWLQPEESRWNRWKFAKRYCAGSNNGFGFDASGASNLPEFRTYLRQLVMVRRLKADVLKELPPKTRQVVTVEAGGELASVVRAEGKFIEANRDAIERAQAELELAKSGTEEEFKSAVNALKDSMHVAFTEMSRLRHETAVAKVPVAIEMIREDLDEVPKMIVFAHHRDVLQELNRAFPGVSVLVTGETNGSDAEAYIRRFQTDPAVRIFFGSIRATGEGITLTAASLVWFMELDWVPGKMCQCEDRAHRIGQRDNVHAKYLVVDQSLDARVMHTLLEKMAVIEQALDSGPSIVDQEMVLPLKYSGGTRRQYHDAAIGISDAQIVSIHDALRRLAGVCDGALKLDGCGYSGVDSRIGHSLAAARALSPAQAALGKRIITKYRRQLGDESLAACGLLTGEQDARCK